MKILIVGDMHLSGKQNPCRKDNVVETQFKKLEEVVNIANDLDINIVSVGDVFDSATIGYSTYSKTAEILNDLHNNFYFVWGNHDLYLHSMDTKEATTLGGLWKAHPKVQQACSLDPFIFATCDWGEEIYAEDNSILISHKAVATQSILDKHKWLEDNKDGCWKIYDLDFKVFICGHYHRQYITGFGTRLIINPGSLVRRKVSEDEQHHPSVILFDTQTWNCDIIKLDCAKPYDEVVSTSHLEIKQITKDIDENIQQFITNLKLEKGDNSGKILQIIKRKLEDPNIDRDVKEILVEILKESFDLEVTLPVSKKPRKLNLKGK